MIRMISKIKQSLLSWRVWVAGVVGFIVASGGLFYYAKTAYGIGAFGGRIESFTFCPVEETIAITVGGVPGMGGTFIYLPETTDLYASYQIFRPGAWVLGTSIGASTCQDFSPDGVFNIMSPKEYIVMAGTSM